MRSVLTQSLTIVAIVVAAAVLTAWFHPRAPAFAPQAAGEGSPWALSWEEVAELPPEGVLWVDARSAEAFNEGHVPGAVLLNEDEWDAGFEEFILRWMPGQTVVVYCDAAACHASEAVSQRLRRELADDQIYFLEGGWQAWQGNH